MHRGVRSATPLHEWLDSLTNRNLTITIDNGHPKIHGPRPQTIGPHDHEQLHVWHHALTIAAAHTHPNWWNHILNRTNTPPTPNDIPWTCATCGNPNIDILDADLVCWCANHLDHANTAPWEAARWGAA